MLTQANKATPDRIKELALELSWFNVISAMNQIPYVDITEKADAMASAADLAAFMVAVAGRMNAETTPGVR